MTASTRPLRRRSGLVALAAAAVAVPLVAVPAAGYEPPGGVRDVREFACPPGQVPNAEFGDVPEGSTFRLNINCLAAYGITQGTSDGMSAQFSPEQPVPRRQMAVFLARMLEDVIGVDVDDSDAGFEDTDGQPEEAQRAINIIANAGISQGRTPTQFDPNALVTRAEMASFLVRTQEFVAGQREVEPFPAGGDSFTDDDGSVHEGNIDALNGQGVALGRSETSFAPDASVTRGQMAAFLTRYLDILAEAGAYELQFPRNNEVLSVDGPIPNDSATAEEDQGEDSDNTRSDDRAYIASDLEPGVEYRITLVTTDSFERVMEDVNGDGTDEEVVRFTGDASSFLADPGETSAKVIEVNGSSVEEPGQSVTATASELGGFQFTVDADTATEIAPFVYPDQPINYQSFSPRLELGEDLRPVEVFGVGDPLTYAEPGSGGPLPVG